MRPEVSDKIAMPHLYLSRVTKRLITVVRRVSSRLLLLLAQWLLATAAVEPSAHRHLRDAVANHNADEEQRADEQDRHGELPRLRAAGARRRLAVVQQTIGAVVLPTGHEIDIRTSALLPKRYAETIRLIITNSIILVASSIDGYNESYRRRTVSVRFAEIIT